MRIYLDTNIIIYHIEALAVWGPRASARLAAMYAAGDVPVVSDLTRMECRVGPLKAGNRALLAAYDAFFASRGVVVVPLTGPVCDRAAELRAMHGFKTPDALNLAAAMIHGCDRFLTNDVRLAACTGIAVELLP
jgi:uncharacterized protein